MNCLLDTHTLLWMLVTPLKLSQKVTEILSSGNSIKYVSIVSLWEISLKYRIGKLKIVGKRPDEIPTALQKLDINILNLDTVIASTFYKIPENINKDPFDLMLAWQTIKGNFILLSKDKGFDDYQSADLNRIW